MSYILVRLGLGLSPRDAVGEEERRGYADREPPNHEPPEGDRRKGVAKCIGQGRRHKEVDVAVAEEGAGKAPVFTGAATSVHEDDRTPLRELLEVLVS